MSKSKITISVPQVIILREIPEIFRRDAFISMIAEIVNKEDLDALQIQSYDPALFKMRCYVITITTDSAIFQAYDNITRLRVVLTAIRKMLEIFNSI